jgi:hypothetical protein
LVLVLVLPPADKKSISLGTKPLQLVTFTNKGVQHVFAGSDRPTIIYSSNGKLLYSNLNEDEVGSPWEGGGGGNGSSCIPGNQEGCPHCQERGHALLAPSHKNPGHHCISTLGRPIVPACSRTSNAVIWLCSARSLPTLAL